MSTRNDILMPKLGLTMTEGMIADWAVKPGDQVKAGQLMFVVETEKVATEIPAPSNGEMMEILVQQGDTVPVGTVVARWTGSGQAAVESESASAAVDHRAAGQGELAHPAASQPGFGSDRVVATPLAKRLAREHDIDIACIVGTGPRGRIKAQDVRDAVSSSQAHPQRMQTEQTTARASVGVSLQAPIHATLSPKPVATHPVSTQTRSTQTTSTNPLAASSAQPLPASSIVTAMAKRMVQAKQEVPHFYLSTEAEVSGLLDLRETLNAQPGFSKLTVNHFLIAAVVRALEDCPFQNRIWLEEQILQFDGVDVGVAVSTDRGLMAPVLHSLQGCTLETIAQRANDLVGRVRAGQARREEMSGGAITISNAGMFNVTYMTPIINPPQSAILGVGSVREVFRPSDNGQPMLKREMGLVLACDHRLHDGSSGLKFLNVVVDYLQNPVWLLRSL